MKKKLFIPSILFLFVSTAAYSQRPQYSITTDLDLQHNFKKGQRYWDVGQTAQLLFNYSRKDGIYARIGYYSFGKFSNALVAPAKDTSTSPQEIDFTNHAQMRSKHISLGWRHFLKGAYDSETGWSLYYDAGFGLMLGRILNAHSTPVDTSLYTVPVLAGKAHFKRLTMDFALGVDMPLGGDIFFYTEARVLVPTTDYPSKYIFANRNAPWFASINFGIRIFFE